MELRMRGTSASITFNTFQQACCISLKQKALKTGHFVPTTESALGAGGRAFKSPRPDQ